MDSKRVDARKRKNIFSFGATGTMVPRICPLGLMDNSEEEETA